MSVAIQVCRVVHVSPEALWAHLDAIETHTEWMADAESITFRTERRRGVGAEFACVTRVGPIRLTDVMRVTEWEPPTAMGIEHRGVVTGRGRFTLRPVGAARTRFCWAEQLRFPWWLGGRLGEQAGRPVLTAIWRRNVARLAERVEAASPSAPV